jgi:hypothetical protein
MKTNANCGSLLLATVQQAMRKERRTPESSYTNCAQMQRVGPTNEPVWNKDGHTTGSRSPHGLIFSSISPLPFRMKSINPF